MRNIEYFHKITADHSGSRRGSPLHTDSATAGRLGRQQTRAMWIHSRRYILPLRGAGLSDRAIVHGTSKSVGDSSRVACMIRGWGAGGGTKSGSIIAKELDDGLFKS